METFYNLLTKYRAYAPIKKKVILIRPLENLLIEESPNRFSINYLFGFLLF